jgi:hypothetical protein
MALSTGQTALPKMGSRTDIMHSKSNCPEYRLQVADNKFNNMDNNCREKKEQAMQDLIHSTVQDLLAHCRLVLPPSDPDRPLEYSPTVHTPTEIAEAVGTGIPGAPGRSISGWATAGVSEEISTE